MCAAAAIPNHTEKTKEKEKRKKTEEKLRFVNNNMVENVIGLFDKIHTIKYVHPDAAGCWMHVFDRKFVRIVRERCFLTAHDFCSVQNKKRKSDAHYAQYTSI